MQEIFIKNEENDISPPSYRHRAFILRNLPDSAVVREVYPLDSWISKEKIIQHAYDAVGHQSWEAWVHLELARGSLRMNLLLVFGVVFRPCPASARSSVPAWDEENFQASTWCTISTLGSDTLQSSPRFARSVREPEHSPGYHEFQGVKLTLNGATSGKDHVPFIDVMGEYMCVVDITSSSVLEETEGSRAQ
jgi:hypothetical protein